MVKGLITSRHLGPRLIVTILLFITLFFVVSCIPTRLNPNLMSQARINLPVNELLSNPIPYENRLFAFGVQIAEVRLTPEGSVIEGLYIPIDETGALIGPRHPNLRIRALLKKEYGLLDPLVYEKGRFVTMAATFKGLQPDRIESLSYLFPYFHIVEVYLWERTYRRPTPPWYYDPWFSDPWPFRFGFGYYWWRR